MNPDGIDPHLLGRVFIISGMRLSAIADLSRIDFTREDDLLLCSSFMVLSVISSASSYDPPDKVSCKA